VSPITRNESKQEVDTLEMELRALVVRLVLLFASIACSTSDQATVDGKHIHSHHHRGRHFSDAVLLKSVAHAKELLAKGGGMKKLAVMFVFTDGIFDGQKDRFLKCSLLKLKDNFLPDTPADIYLWLPMNSTRLLPHWLSELRDVHVMEIQSEAWFVSSLANDTQWVGRDAFDMNYYLTGRWRLTFRFVLRMLD
jgi:hypothetical protein